MTESGITEHPDPPERARELLDAANAVPRDSAVTVIEAHPAIERFLRAAPTLVADLLGVIRERETALAGAQRERDAAEAALTDAIEERGMADAEATRLREERDALRARTEVPFDLGWNVVQDDPHDRYPWAWTADMEPNPHRLGSIHTPNGRRPDGTMHTYWGIAYGIWEPDGHLICATVNRWAHDTFGTLLPPVAPSPDPKEVQP